MSKKIVAWLSEVNCASCKELIYLQVGAQAIPEKYWEAIKGCCENQKKEISYTPIED